MGGTGRCKSAMWTSWVATKEEGEVTGQFNGFVGDADGLSEKKSLWELD